MFDYIPLTARFARVPESAHAQQSCHIKIANAVIAKYAQLIKNGHVTSSCVKQHTIIHDENILANLFVSAADISCLPPSGPVVLRDSR